MANQFGEAFQAGDIDNFELSYFKDENLKACSRVSTYSDNGLSSSTIISMEEENRNVTDQTNDLEVADEQHPQLPRNNEYHSPVVKRITKQEYSCINLNQINKKRKIMQTFIHLADCYEEEKEHVEVSEVDNACYTNDKAYEEK